MMNCSKCVACHNDKKGKKCEYLDVYLTGKEEVEPCRDNNI